MFQLPMSSNITNFANMRLAQESKFHAQLLLSVVAQGSHSLSQVASLISDAKRIVVMTGAGISVSAGIPDFRSIDGLFNNPKLKELKLARPEQVFDLNYFRRKPEVFYSVAKQILPGLYKPTPTHHFLGLLHDHNKIHTHFTQNVDTLERLAGANPDLLMEAHGSFAKLKCIECGKEYSPRLLKECVVDKESPEVPRCQAKRCNGALKPSIVFYGESLPASFTHCVKKLHDCDLLLILGTSLKVMPFAAITQLVPPHVPRVLVNREATGMAFPEEYHRTRQSPKQVDSDSDSDTDGEVLGVQGLRFHLKSNKRDTFLQGDCDDVSKALADELGWTNDLYNKLQQYDKKKTDVWDTLEGLV